MTDLTTYKFKTAIYFPVVTINISLLCIFLVFFFFFLCNIHLFTHVHAPVTNLVNFYVLFSFYYLTKIPELCFSNIIHIYYCSRVNRSMESRGDGTAEPTEAFLHMKETRRCHRKICLIDIKISFELKAIKKPTPFSAWRQNINFPLL